MQVSTEDLFNIGKANCELCRRVSDILRSCIYLNRSASNLLFRRIQKIKKSILPQSM